MALSPAHVPATCPVCVSCDTRSTCPLLLLPVEVVLRVLRVLRVRRVPPMMSLLLPLELPLVCCVFYRVSFLNNFFVMPPKFQPPLYDHRLPREDCAADIQYGIRLGESWLIGYTEDEVWDHIMAPIENLQCQALRDHGRPDLLPLVPRYNAFLILLPMVRPMQVHGVWDRKGLLYNPYMANMLTRRQYYLLQRLLRTDVVSLLEDCNGQ